LSLIYPFIKRLIKILKESLEDYDDKTIDENDIKTVELFDLLNDNENNIDFVEVQDVFEVVVYEANQSRGQKTKININQSVKTKDIIHLLKESLLY